MRNIIGGQIGYDNLLIKKKNILKNKQILFNGRSALHLILEMIKKKIEIIYLPNYICKSILQSVKKTGLNYKFYNIKKNFRFNFPKKKNSAVIILNYFGIYNDKVEKLKNNYSKNIFYIKDCTHDIFSKENSFKSFNKKNIYKFASIKKYIPFPVGAITNIDKICLKSQNKKFNLIINNFFKILIKRNIYFSYPNKEINFKREFELLKKQDEFKNFENKNLIDNDFCTSIKNKIYKYNLKKILKKRDENFKYLKNLLNRKIKIVSQNSSFPLNMTILLKKDQKRKIVEILKKKRIISSTLWPLPNEIKSKKSIYSNKITEKILSLPVDHRYNKKDIEFMASIIHKSLKL